jgi:hypothetical protein
MKFKPGDNVRMLYDGVYHYGEVTVVSAYMGVKVMFSYDNDREPAYWYYKPEELELITEDDVKT